MSGVLTLHPAAGAAQNGDAAHSSPPCPVCEISRSLARDLADKATELKNKAQAAQDASRLQTDPSTLRWPGPARLDSGSTIWTHQQTALAQVEAADRSNQIAMGVELLAQAAARAASACLTENICSAAQRVVTPTSPACSVIGGNPTVDLDSILSPIRATTRALETEALTCSAMACPGADCKARHALLEGAAFAEGILSAAVGETSQTVVKAVPSDLTQTPTRAPGSVTMSGLEALSRLALVFDTTGLDPKRTQELATSLANIEKNLIKPVSGEGRPPRWRRVSLRLALAGMRDALGSLRLEKRVSQPAAWERAADRLETAIKSLMRLERTKSAGVGAKVSATPAASCPGVDPQLTRTLFQLRRAINASATCSVRSGCSAQEAIDQGTQRAALLVGKPVLEPRLELIKTLEEEVAISPAVLSDASVSAEPVPGISLTRAAYQQGSAIELDLEIRNNRCLANGGHVALVPLDEADGAIAISVDLLADTVEQAETSNDPKSRLLFRAPPEGLYTAAVYAGAAEGGALLAATPLRVTKPEPQHCNGWTGIWRTEFGRLVTVQHDDETVTGSYGRVPGVQPGFLFGRIRNTQLRGVWVSEISSGGARLTLEGDGVFRGSWGLSPDQVTNGGRWSGVCIAEALDDQSREETMEAN
ncbi:MAG: hypothetical protein R8J41_14025 [Alphaproteobacteria bacterium]|nr:hypothetical protein [Alphaproteobacteria bacterium]